MKVETEGFESLSTAERSELTLLLQRMEQALTVKVDGRVRDALRAKAHDDFYRLFHPELAHVLRYANGRQYDVHHLIPLEHAHLFPQLDINAAANLVMLHELVHTRISTLWTTLRKNRVVLTAQEADRVVGIIDNHFGARWYNRADVPESELPLLDKAREAAMMELRQLFPGIR